MMPSPSSSTSTGRPAIINPLLPRPRQRRSKQITPIRSKFFHSIGILKNHHHTPSSLTNNNSSDAALATKRSVKGAPRYNAPLRYIYDHRGHAPPPAKNKGSPRCVMHHHHHHHTHTHNAEEERDDHEQISEIFGIGLLLNEAKEKEKRRSVNFQETVTVVPIPMRNEFSDRIKAKLWMDRATMCETIDRNLLEYASERRDWRNVCQEEEMYLCGATRDLIHPVHLETGRYHFSTGGRCERSSYS